MLNFFFLSNFLCYNIDCDGDDFIYILFNNYKIVLVFEIIKISIGDFYC